MTMILEEVDVTQQKTKIEKQMYNTKKLKM